jgi:hypothetical protein
LELARFLRVLRYSTLGACRLEHTIRRLARFLRVLEHSMLDETAFRVSEQHSMLATHSVFQKQTSCVPEHVFHVKQHSFRAF